MSVIYPKAVMFGDVIVRESQRLMLLTLTIDDSSVKQFGSRNKDGHLVVETAIPILGLMPEIERKLDEAGVPA